MIDRVEMTTREYDAQGNLIAEDTLIFTVLPALFDTMGSAGVVVGFAFFVLMSIAALTSSISMLEVPVAYAVERHGIERRTATFIVGGAITVLSSVLILNFSTLFGLAVAVATRYSQPMLGLLMCAFAGWIWQRNSVIAEVSKHDPAAVGGLFLRVWPNYVRFVCPALIIIVFVQTFLG